MLIICPIPGRIGRTLAAEQLSVAAAMPSPFPWDAEGIASGGVGELAFSIFMPWPK